MFSINPTMKKTSLLLLLIILILAAVPGAARAQDGMAASVEVAVTSDGVQIVWSAPAAAGASAAAAASLLPAARYNGYDLPLQTITLSLAPGAAADVSIEQLQSTTLVGGIAPGAPLAPPVLDWTPMPNVLPDEPASLPAAPAFVMREGMVKGQHIAVLAISPIFEEAGVVKLATDLRVFVPGAALVSAAGDMVAASPYSPAQPEAVVVPINDAALQNGYRVEVSTPGIQEIPFSAIGGAGNAANVRLVHRGETVAIERLSDRLRFYAPEVGDRWNATSVYWLTLDGSGASMQTAGAPVSSPPAGQPAEHGVWRNNKLYVSEYPGLDDDHWYNTSLTVAGAAAAQSAPGVTIPITVALPAASGQSTFTASVTVIKSVPNNACQADVKGYKVRADFLNASGGVLDSQVYEWNPSPFTDGRCQFQDSWALSWTTSTQPAQLKLTLLPSGVAGYDTSILLDAVEWSRPVALNFGGNGAEFRTPAGAWSFTWTGLPQGAEGWRLYDVTDPRNPLIVPATAGGFAQDDSATPRHYVLAELGSLAAPSVSAHAVVNFGDVRAADAIYIGPVRFREEVQPLIELRQSQGYTPLFVDVQGIFDVYGDGYIAATAIRNFLRDRSDWQNAQRTISVVLVGDGTFDPFNYRGTAIPAGAIHPIPPYMANVDIYINETACETCFAQLNGDDPVTGDAPNAFNPKSNVFVPDVWIGRFPVRNEAELTAMVSKIVAYEQAAGGQALHTGALFMADNFITSINAQNQVTIDPAGDFADFSDEIVALFGYGADVQRVYYDHSPDRKVDYSTATGSSLLNTVPRSAVDPWRIPSANDAKQKVIDTINAGVGLVIYNGHSNHWNYAKLEDRSGAAIAPLMSIVDVGSLTNRDELFVGLSMTCLTSQFAMPAVSGTVDELLVRSPTGGAVAMWGPSGQSVAHGHDYLQKGFVSSLRTAGANGQRMGALVEAGYNNLLTSPLQGSLDALKTFVVLGDPLTKVRVSAGFDNGIFLPTVQR